MFQREDDDDVFSPKISPHTPPSADVVLRKSNRLDLSTKRSYKGMQSRHSGEGRSHKRFKYIIHKVNGFRDTIDELSVATLRQMPWPKKSLSTMQTLQARLSISVPSRSGSSTKMIGTEATR